MNELYIKKLIRLINIGLISVDDIKDTSYKAEVEGRINNEV
jgi:hypothetical protein